MCNALWYRYSETLQRKKCKHLNINDYGKNNESKC